MTWLHIRRAKTNTVDSGSKPLCVCSYLHVRNGIAGGIMFSLPGQRKVSLPCFICQNCVAHLYVSRQPPWNSGTDPSTGRTYFYNVATGVSQWEAPKWESGPTAQMAPSANGASYPSHDSYRDSRDSYGGGGGGGGYGGGGGGGHSFGGGRGQGHRPFQDISNLPPDDQSKVRPEIVEWRRKHEITVAGDCPGKSIDFSDSE